MPADSLETTEVHTHRLALPDDVAGLPLCVDLDGTLLKTDMLQESLVTLLKQRPLAFCLVPFWLTKGRAYMKREIAKRVTLDLDELPYHESLVAALRAEAESGRTLVLATASEKSIAAPIAERAGFFDDVIASEGVRNIAGRNKAAVLKERFPQGYIYAGNAPADFAVWREAKGQVAISPSRKFLDVVRRAHPEAVIIHEKRNLAKTLIRALRLHQWVKNLLLIAPIIMAHKIADLPRLVDVALAFFCFGLCASSVYMLNDLLDLTADRLHQRKRHRPFASGDLPIFWGMALIPVFLALGFGFATVLPSAFLASLAIYFAITVAYSFYLKRIVLIDILVLASLYTLRVLAGGYAAETPVSQWLLAFSMFLFLSLAAVKRFSELYSLRRSNRERTAGRGYRASDLEQIAQFGSASGYISVLVLALYVSSEEVARLYAQPRALWLICPVLLYWISRVWLLAHRGELNEDPIVFAITDKVSYLAGFIALVVMLLAI